MPKETEITKTFPEYGTELKKVDGDSTHFINTGISKNHWVCGLCPSFGILNN
jgi:hypothetical protein